MKCKDCRDLLSPYLDGELPAERTGEVAGHLSDCSSCREEFDGMRATSRLVASLPRARLTVDLAGPVVARASAAGWREMWAAMRQVLASRQAVVLRELGRAAAVVALFLIAAAGTDQRAAKLLVSWPLRVAGVADSGVSYLAGGIAEASALIGRPGPASKPSRTREAPVKRLSPAGRESSWLGGPTLT